MSAFPRSPGLGWFPDNTRYGRSTNPAPLALFRSQFLVTPSSAQRRSEHRAPCTGCLLETLHTASIGRAKPSRTQRRRTSRTRRCCGGPRGFRTRNSWSRRIYLRPGSRSCRGRRRSLHHRNMLRTSHNGMSTSSHPRLHRTQDRRTPRPRSTAGTQLFGTCFRGRIRRRFVHLRFRNKDRSQS